MLSYTRFCQLLDGQTAIAKKVFGATPISEEWTLHQIQAELIRTGQGRERQATEGALRGLVRTGLVAETKNGFFQRAKCKDPPSMLDLIEKAAAQKQPQENAMTAKPALIKNPAPHIDKLAMISNQARSIAEQIKELASNIETAAIEIDEQIKQGTEETAKLKQLQQLLKSLG